MSIIPKVANFLLNGSIACIMATSSAEKLSGSSLKQYDEEKLSSISDPMSIFLPLRKNCKLGPFFPNPKKPLLSTVLISSTSINYSLNKHCLCLADFKASHKNN